MNSTELNRTDANYDRYALMIRIGWLFAFIMLAVVVYRWWYPYQIFDSKAWKAADRYQSKTRLGMATYLVESQTLIGMTKAEVFDLLGQPDGLNKYVDTHHTWHAGPGQGAFSFVSILGIKLDKNDRVVEAFIVED